MYSSILGTKIEDDKAEVEVVVIVNGPKSDDSLHQAFCTESQLLLNKCFLLPPLSDTVRHITFEMSLGENNCR